MQPASSKQAPIEALNQRFAIEGIAHIEPGSGGLPRIVINTAAASAEIYLHGAQITSWRPSGAEEVLFLSQHSRWEDGRAIRGGIPICFPWFRAKADSPQAPAHGVVRTKAWQLDSLTHKPGQVNIALSTASDEATRRWWPCEFHLSHRITVGTELRLELTATNTGTAPFRFEEALHTYHQVADATAIQVSGLDGATFLDNMDGNRQKTQLGGLGFHQQTDNAYPATTHALELIDPVLHRRIITRKENSQTTVAWNPWREGAASLADLGDEEWQRLACVEAANILGDAITLEPGAQHTMSATLALALDA